MALNVNDALSRGWTRLRASAGGNATISGATRIMAVSLTAAAAAATLRLDNAATAGAATDSIDLGAAIGTTTYVRFGPNGTLFGTAVSTALGGAGALFTIYYVAE